MVTLIKYGALSGGEKYNVNVMELDGLSTDTKPNGIYIEYGSDGREIVRMAIPNGSVFTEVDTGKTYMYDATGGDWSEVSIGGGGEDVSKHFKAGANIIITDNADGTQTISASGDISAEDDFAREQIEEHKADKANPHEVTKAQVGLGNVDNTADIDKPLSTAAQTALAAKANSADVYTKSEVDELVEGIDVPTTLAELTDDATHRVVSDTEKTAWNNKSDFSGSYNDLTDKPTIPDELSDLTDDATHRTVTDTEKATWNAKADAADIPTVPVKGVEKNGTALTPDASGVVNITVPTTAADVSALPATTLYGASISLSINTTTFVVTATLKDQNGDTLGTAQTIDLPLESVVVNGSYNSATKKVVLTLQNGSTVEFSVADLVAGLQSEITSTNKLDADLVDDSTSTNKFVSSAEKSAWNDKQSAITNSNKLSSDLVDDTNSTHKFATAAQLAQIATNASDISDIQTTIGNINSVLEGVL